LGDFLKFQQIAALEQHIESTLSSKNAIRSYLILHSQREERRKLLEKISKRISMHTQAEVSFQEGKEWDLVSHTLAAPSLFGDVEVIVWDGVKNLSEEISDKLLKYIVSPSPWAFLLIGSDSFKSFSSLYKKVSKELVVFDLAEEKPWDKEKRQQQEILQKVKLEGKSITPGALVKLLSLSEDSLTLESELMKVIAYIGDQFSIAEKDVEAVTHSSSVARWQIAEELIWEKGKDHEVLDLSALLALVGQVRFLLYQARQINSYLREGKNQEEIMKVANMRATPLQKILQRIKSYKGEYFDAALSMLCDLEILAKNSSLDSEFLFQYLRIKFTQLKKTYAR
jgi:DNA polymerase III delta subunit